MIAIRHHIWVLLTVLFAVVAAVLGIGNPISPAQAATPTTIVQATTSASVTLDSTDYQNVQLITLPAGSWVVMAKGFVKSSSNQRRASCRLWDGTHNVPLDVSAGSVNNSFRANMITNVATLQVPTGAQVRVWQQCVLPDQFGVPAKVEAGATELAFQADYRLIRTSASVKLGGDPLTVTTLTLPGGTWMVGYKTTTRYSGPSDGGNARVKCFIAPKDKEPPARRNVGAPSSRSPQVATMVGYRAVEVNGSSSGVVQVQCATDLGKGATVESNAVLWAWSAGTVARRRDCSELGHDHPIEVGAAFVGPNTDHGPCDFGAGYSADSVAKIRVGKTLTTSQWVVLGAEGDMFSADERFARCEVRNLTQETIVDPNASAWLEDGLGAAVNPEATHTGTTYLGSFTTTGFTTIDFRCGLSGTLTNGRVATAGYHILFRPLNM